MDGIIKVSIRWDSFSNLNGTNTEPTTGCLSPPAVFMHSILLGLIFKFLRYFSKPLPKTVTEAPESSNPEMFRPRTSTSK